MGFATIAGQVIFILTFMTIMGSAAFIYTQQTRISSESFSAQSERFIRASNTALTLEASYDELVLVRASNIGSTSLHTQYIDIYVGDMRVPRNLLDNNFFLCSSINETNRCGPITLGHYYWETDSLNVLWRFEQPSWDGTPNEVIDSSGSGNHGTSSGNAQVTDLGKMQQGALFDGIGHGNQYLFSDTITLSENDFTVALWMLSKGNGVYLDSSPYSILGLFGHAMDGDLGSNYQQLMYDTQLRNVHWDLFQDDGCFQDVGAQSPLNSVLPNTWNHIAITWNRTHGHLFVNGNLVDSFMSSMCSYLPTQTVYVGADRNGFNTFNGTIDEFSVWERILSADEIRQLFWKGWEATNPGIWDSQEHLELAIDISVDSGIVPVKLVTDTGYILTTNMVVS